MPTWLDAATVTGAMSEDVTDELDTNALQFWCNTVRDYVEDRRPDLVDTVDDVSTFAPPARVVGGAVLLAFRLYQRRSSIEQELKSDPDIGRMLGVGKYRRWGFGGAAPLTEAVV